jgi:hypothetical protein
MVAEKNMETKVHPATRKNAKRKGNPLKSETKRYSIKGIILCYYK